MLVRSNCMKCLIEFAGYVIVTNNNNNNNKNKLNWESEQVRPPRGRFNDRLIMLSERFELEQGPIKFFIKGPNMENIVILYFFFVLKISGAGKGGLFG